VSALPRLLLVTHRHRIAGPSLAVALEEAFRAGLRFAILRERDLAARDLLEMTRRCVRIAHARGATLVVNDRLDVALLGGADGVHLRASSVPVAAARGFAGEGVLVGASVHTPEEARAAAADGADYLLFGPVYETADKARFRAPAGIAQLARVVRAATRRGRTRVPVYAIGGVTPERVRECVNAGAHGVAAMSGILAATSIRARVRAYLEALR
jgi:thiamine-phosphate pyrophosphorylase